MRGSERRGLEGAGWKRSALRSAGAHACWVGLVATVGCSTRSPLGEDGSGGAGGSDLTAATSGSGGGVVPLACGTELTAREPVLVDAAGGAPSRVAAVFGTNSGQVVSLFHGWSSPSAPSALRVSTLEPWGAWPPASSEAFVFDPNGGDSFAVANVGYGEAATVFQHVDPADGDGLSFVPDVSATSATGLLPLTVESSDATPYAVAIVPGYDEPPVAINVGYLASLAVWGARDAESGAHALRYGVGMSGVYVLEGITTRPAEQDLACASSPVAADAVRVGKAWWVFAGSGSPLGPCAFADAGPPTALAFDVLAWGAPDAVDWTLSRAGTVTGEGAITRVRAAALGDAAWVLVARDGQPDLELTRFDASGAGEPSLRVPSAPVSSVVEARLIALADGLVLAYVDAASPEAVQVELRDREGALRGATSFDAKGSVSSLTAIASKDGDAALFSWTADGPGGPQLFVARADCGGAL